MFRLHHLLKAMSNQRPVTGDCFRRGRDGIGHGQRKYQVDQMARFEVGGPSPSTLGGFRPQGRVGLPQCARGAEDGRRQDAGCLRYSLNRMRTCRHVSITRQYSLTKL
jgi:hypothetical protein